MIVKSWFKWIGKSKGFSLKKSDTLQCKSFSECQCKQKYSKWVVWIQILSCSDGWSGLFFVLWTCRTLYLMVLLCSFDLYSTFKACAGELWGGLNALMRTCSCALLSLNKFCSHHIRNKLFVQLLLPRLVIPNLFAAVSVVIVFKNIMVITGVKMFSMVLLINLIYILN